jgi:putative SOS response-associated peptidase YedK
VARGITALPLKSNDFESWLNPSMRDVRVASGWLLPYAVGMRCYAVSTRINNVQNDDEDCTKAMELDQLPQGQLFT